MVKSTPIVRSRIAPTPSGFLHFGNVLSFVVTALLTRSLHGVLRLRIDDLDRSRFRRAYLEDIFRWLDLLKLPIHEGPSGVADFQEHHSQTLRTAAYHQLLKTLHQEGLVYNCQCSRQSFSALPTGSTCPCSTLNLSEATGGAAWRLFSLPERQVVRDLDGVEHDVALRSRPGFIPLRQRDGSPSYQIASLSDDLTYQVNLVVRGADLIPSTALQLHLSELLQSEAFRQAQFFHHQLLLRAGQKLSKSAGASKKSLLSEGLTASACYGEIAKILGVSSSPVHDFESLYEHIEASLIQRFRAPFTPLLNTP